jgi:hypothetical protein
MLSRKTTQTQRERKSQNPTSKHQQSHCDATAFFSGLHSSPVPLLTPANSDQRRCSSSATLPVSGPFQWKGRLPMAASSSSLLAPLPAALLRYGASPRPPAGGPSAADSPSSCRCYGYPPAPHGSLLLQPPARIPRRRPADPAATRTVSISSSLETCNRTLSLSHQIIPRLHVNPRYVSGNHSSNMFAVFECDRWRILVFSYRLLGAYVLPFPREGADFLYAVGFGGEVLREWRLRAACDPQGLE